MKIRHKIAKLSILSESQKIISGFAGYFRKERILRFQTGSIAFVSLASLIFNFLFPHIAFASDVGRNNILSFNFSETPKVLSFENDIISANEISINGLKNESRELLMLPVEQALENQNDKMTEQICKDAGIKDMPCWQDLKAMRQKESFDGKKMIGDGGKSRGWYHIQIKLHGVSNDCALDFKCSTEWTVRNLIANSYKTNRFYAISKHNGGGRMALIYARSVVNNSAKFER